MVIGERIRELRKNRNLSQGEMEKRCGLLRCYISRVEHGHTIPSLETIEKLAAALDVPLYHVFYEGRTPPSMQRMAPLRDLELSSKLRGNDRSLRTLCSHLAKMSEFDRSALMVFARKLASRRRALRAKA